MHHFVWSKLLVLEAHMLRAALKPELDHVPARCLAFAIRPRGRQPRDVEQPATGCRPGLAIRRAVSLVIR